MTESLSPTVLIILGVIIGSGAIGSFITISQFVGSSDMWNEIQDQTASIWITSLIGSIALFVAGFLYFRMNNNNHEKIMYFIFVVTFLAMGFATSALGVALIHKK